MATTFSVRRLSPQCWQRGSFSEALQNGRMLVLHHFCWSPLSFFLFRLIQWVFMKHLLWTKSAALGRTRVTPHIVQYLIPEISSLPRPEQLCSLRALWPSQRFLRKPLWQRCKSTGEWEREKSYRWHHPTRHGVWGKKGRDAHCVTHSCGVLPSLGPFGSAHRRCWC